MTRRALSLAGLTALALGGAATQAPATGTGPVQAIDNVFTQGGYNDPGQPAHFENLGTNTHNVTAQGSGPDGNPLFRTGNTPGGGVRTIEGIPFLDTGDYPYVCTLHPGMDGVFEVSNRLGEPLPRPDISLKLKSRKLAKVIDSGKVKVRVKANEPTPAENIKLKAKKGKKAITKGKTLNLAAGGAKTVKLKLSNRGVEKLSGIEAAKIKVQGTVDFGFGDKASKKLK
jgi:plastocyanin